MELYYNQVKLRATNVAQGVYLVRVLSLQISFLVRFLETRRHIWERGKASSRCHWLRSARFSAVRGCHQNLGEGLLSLLMSL